MLAGQVVRRSGVVSFFSDALMRLFRRMYKRLRLPKLSAIVVENCVLPDVYLDDDRFHIVKLESLYKSLLSQEAQEVSDKLKMTNYDLWLSRHVTPMKRVMTKLRWDTMGDGKPFLLILGSRELAKRLHVRKKNTVSFQMCDRMYEEVTRATDVLGLGFMRNLRSTEGELVSDEYENVDHLIKLCHRWLKKL